MSNSIENENIKENSINRIKENLEENTISNTTLYNIKNEKRFNDKDDKEDDMEGLENLINSLEGPNKTKIILGYLVGILVTLILSYIYYILTLK